MCTPRLCCGLARVSAHALDSMLRLMCARCEDCRASGVACESRTIRGSLKGCMTSAYSLARS
jgi:hypothetical protein